MSTRFTCDDTETLVAYLYDEADPDTRAAVARHLVECARCRGEVTALGGVRHALAQWTPPAPPLRFSLGQADLPSAESAAADNLVRPRVAAWQAVPVWAQVAAATLAVAVGAALANVQVRHDAEGWTVSTGWMAPAATPPTASQPWRQELAALEQALRSEMTVRQAAAPVAASERAPAAAGTGPAVGAVQSRFRHAAPR
jgi:anti-sigma factor RsiW